MGLGVRVGARVGVGIGGRVRVRARDAMVACPALGVITR